MPLVRLHLRFWVMLWLVFQAASLAAFVPGNCCADHERAHGASDDDAGGQTSASCHEATPAAQCPMRGADGTPCPMHQSATQGQRDPQAADAAQSQAPTQTHDHHQEHRDAPVSNAAPSSQPGTSDCALRGTCGGPMAALGTVLSNVGVMPAPIAALASAPSVPVSPVPDATTASYFEPPDAPPPRA